MYKLIILIIWTLFYSIDCSVTQFRKVIDDKFDDLYLQCKQNGGSKLCIGLTQTNSRSDSDCVLTKQCVLLFQFEIVDPGRLNKTKN